MNFRRWNKRNLLARIVPNRIKWFDRINDNADFVRVRRRFDDLPQCAERFQMYDQLSALVGSLPVDYLEFGVWRGESIGRWSKLLSNANSRLFGFDTFSGLPEDWIADHPKGTFDVHGKLPSIADPRVQFYPGLFQATLSPFLDLFERQAQLIVHIDCDIYSATLYVLAALNPILKRGDILIFDDFHSVEHEFYAFFDFVRAFYRNWTPLAAVSRCTSVAVRLE